MNQPKPKYKTWIRNKAIILFAILTIISLLGISFTFFSLWFILLTIPTFLFGYILTIISISAFRFSQKGNDYQNKIHKLILSKLNNVSPNEILDIGCGNGHLSIEMAKTYQNAKITGIDYWGPNWEYSKSQTERNAQLEGVYSRTKFVKGTASNLAINDNSFDNVTSCLTFHEVQDTKDKLICLKEAIRVLKPAGRFALFDLFLDPKFYPHIGKIKEYIEINGGQILEIKKLDEYMSLPFPLKNKKVLGYGMLIIGIKK